MALDYFILVFIASTGVYQIAAIYARLDGLRFFPGYNLLFISLACLWSAVGFNIRST